MLRKRRASIDLEDLEGLGEAKTKIARQACQDDILEKYDMIGYYGTGVSGVVLRVRHKVTGETYAAKFTCLNKSSKDEYDIAERITSFHDELKNVTIVYECGLVSPQAVQEIFSKYASSWPGAVRPLNRGPLKKCEEGVMVIIMEEIDDTLGSKIGQVQPRHLFQIYYVVYQLMRHGIHAYDLHLENIGMKEMKAPMTYQLPQCQITFEPGLQVKLIDYGAYRLSKHHNPENQISHSQVVMLLDSLWNLDLDLEDDETYLFWKAINSVEPFELAENVLASLAEYLNPPECTLTEPARKGNYYGAMQELKLVRPLTYDEGQDILYTYQTSPTYSRPEIYYRIDATRAGRTSDNWRDTFQQLPQRQQLYYKDLYHKGYDLGFGFEPVWAEAKESDKRVEEIIRKIDRNDQMRRVRFSR